jgi:hypothetical protein
MKRILTFSFIMGILLILLTGEAVFAQTYSFSLPQETVDVYWESDGTARIEYDLVLSNDPSADPMQYVDIGIPTASYDLSSIQATINGSAITDIQPSPYVKPGVAIGLGAKAIPPGSTGELSVTIGKVSNVLYVGDETGYASALFAPSWFDKDYVHGTTDLTVRFHLPPGVQPDEPRYHKSPSSWPQDAPLTGLDKDGRVVYEWDNANANGYTVYDFGASFPAKYVPAGSLQKATLTQRLNIDWNALMPFCCFGGVGLFFVLIIAASFVSQRKRKLAYLPPKIAIEGHGIKRGLTAVEAAILLEIPLDRILTMMLFSVIKKGAAKVVKEDPLEIELSTPQPEGLQPYETEFLKAMMVPDRVKRQKDLQQLIIELVKSVQSKMKGFSLKETKDYYQSIVKQAWNQVETAETPEVKSERFADTIEWSMLDRDWDDRTRRVFRTGPVFLPPWWVFYSPSTVSAPTMGGGGVTPTRATISHSAGGISLPRLPGADFAAKLVNGVQNTAGKLVSNVTEFTGGVTKTTNPPPPVSRTSGGGRSSGGGGCACACACAGCACACAGGGR